MADLLHEPAIAIVGSRSSGGRMGFSSGSVSFSGLLLDLATALVALGFTEHAGALALVAGFGLSLVRGCDGSFVGH